MQTSNSGNYRNTDFSLAAFFVIIMILLKVPRMDKRVVAIAKLGYKKCIVPKTAEKSLASLNLDIRVLGCRNLKEVINTVFQSEYNA